MPGVTTSVGEQEFNTDVGRQGQRPGLDGSKIHHRRAGHHAFHRVRREEGGVFGYARNADNASTESFGDDIRLFPGILNGGRQRFLAKRARITDGKFQ